MHSLLSIEVIGGFVGTLVILAWRLAGRRTPAQVKPINKKRGI